MKPLLLFVLSLLFAVPLQAVERIAIVIGNSLYDAQQPLPKPTDPKDPGNPNLPNPVNDAALVHRTFKALGFTLIPAEQPLTNATRQQMLTSLNLFVSKARGAELAVIYYAGHGAANKDSNHIIPVDAFENLQPTVDAGASEEEKEADFAAQLETHTLSHTQLLDKLKNADVKARVLVLDCCRDSGLARKTFGLQRDRSSGGEGGMVAINRAQLPPASLVMFSAGPGETAKDGAGSNSVFTENFAKQIQTGKDIYVALRDVSVEVKKAVTRQTPWLESFGDAAALADIHFAPATYVAPPDDEIARLRAENARMKAEQEEAARQKPQQVAKMQTGGSTTALPVVPTPSKACTPATATKDAPFINALGMKFVPAVSYKDGKKTLFSIWETRSRDYAAFVKASGHYAGDGWKTFESDGVPVGRGANERAEDSLHPVVEVSWDDATAFCAWLTQTERAAGRIGAGDEYRLPTDVEWSYAVGIGDKEDASASPEAKGGKVPDVYPWDGDFPPPNNSGNYVDSSAKAKFSSFTAIDGYSDGYATTAPVGSYAANRLGIYDLGGNVWEWCQDTYSPTSTSRVLRGASWCSLHWSVLASSYRDLSAPDYRSGDCGFRCVVVVGSSSP